MSEMYQDRFVSRSNFGLDLTGDVPEKTETFDEAMARMVVSPWPVPITPITE